MTAPGTAPIRIFAVAVFGIALFSAMDAVMKGLVLGLGVYNTMLWRAGAAILITGAVYAVKRRGRPSRRALLLHFVRALVGTVMALLFFWGLARVPMAQAIALTYIAPLLSLVLAALFLKERIGRTTVGASLIAFAGVAVIMVGQSRSALGETAFFGAAAVLGSALCYAWNIILMRQQALVAEPVEIVFVQSLFVGLFLLTAAPFLAVPPPAARVPEIVLAALLMAASLAILSIAYGRAEASYLAPSEYSSFLWAALYGFVLFGEHVSAWTVAGAAMIVVGCIVAARRRPASFAEPEAAIP